MIVLFVPLCQEGKIQKPLITDFHLSQPFRSLNMKACCRGRNPGQKSVAEYILGKLSYFRSLPPFLSRYSVIYIPLPFSLVLFQQGP